MMSIEGTSEMWNRFDRIVCMHFTPKSERLPKLMSELDRVGISSSGKLDMEFTTPWFFTKMINWKKKGVNKKITMNIREYTLQCYILLKRLQYQKFNHVLFLEDDIVFRKDLGEIKNILDATPDDYDIMNYAPFRRKGWMGNGKGCWGKYFDLEGNEVSQNWNESIIMRYDSVVYDSSCLGLSKKAIDRIVERMESESEPLGAIDQYTYGKNGEMKDLNLYCTTGDNAVAMQDKNAYVDKLNGNTYEDTLEHCYPTYDLSKFNFSSSQNTPVVV